MASKVLFPPIVDSYYPAFVAGGGQCKIYFRLSKFNSIKDFNNDTGCVHISIVKQDTNMNVVNKALNKNKTGTSIRYYSTGIIINANFTAEDKNGLFSVTIQSSELYPEQTIREEDGSEITYKGFIPDWIYKIQLRLSSSRYDGVIPQESWLNTHASDFSEWSTVCTIKAIRNINYTIDILNINTKKPNEQDNTTTTTTVNTRILPLTGHFVDCGNENIYSYNFILYDVDGVLIENSGIIYANQYQDNKSFNYTLKTTLENETTYKLEFKYETVNHYIGGAYVTDAGTDNRYEFFVQEILIDPVKCEVKTAGNSPDGQIVVYSDKQIGKTGIHIHKIPALEFSPSYPGDSDDNNEEIEEQSGEPRVLTTVFDEEEEGRMGLKLYSSDDIYFSGNLCIRRASSKDNYALWDDIIIYPLKEKRINDLPLIFDYTIESGVYYTYAVQKISENGERGQLSSPSEPDMRNFNYSFLLGQKPDEDEETEEETYPPQLKLMFDNTMGSFKIQHQESKIDPIGAIYPSITRNAATRYKTFPVNGLISFWMDENNTFSDTSKYQNGKTSDYYYIYEKEFRDKVLDFLNDGEMKLFKSPTEGNIIVRLMDVNCTPVQELGRQLYRFSAIAYEMAENTMENYLKYKFCDPGKYSSDLSVAKTKLGQLQMSFDVSKKETDEGYVAPDIISEIYKKYDGQGKNIGGFKIDLLNIHHLKITFDSPPLRIKNRNSINNSGDLVMGYNMLYNNGTMLTTYAPVRQYEFDDHISFTRADHIILQGNERDSGNKPVETVSVTVDFLYDVKREVYVDRQIASRQAKICLGQVCNEYQPGESIYNEMYYKYRIKGQYGFRELMNVSSIDIEANPGVVLEIKDAAETNSERHIINYTGRLQFYDIERIDKLRYVGIQNPDGTIDTTKNADIKVDFIFTLVTGLYKE